MILAGLTGGPGCGKSTALAAFAQLGWYTLDADRLCHELYGEDAVKDVIRGRWGDAAVLSADGTINRKGLADIVFSNPADLEWLNAYLHPLIRERGLAKGREEAGGKPLIFDVPLLFEKDWDKECRWTIAVWCDPGRQKERLVARGWSDNEIYRRLSFQWSADKKLENAKLGLINTGSQKMLFEQCKELDKYMRKD